MGWTRLDSSWHQEKRHRRVGLFGRLVLQAAVQMSEARDWQRDERRGWVPKDSFDAEEIALHLALTSDLSLLEMISAEDLALALDLGIAKCAREGLLQPAGDAGWWIDGWSAYRKDPTATTRKQRERAKKRGKARHGDTRDGAQDDASAEGSARADGGADRVTDGHAGHRDKAGHAGADDALESRGPPRHGDDRDVTPRDVTSRPPEEEEGSALPPPPPEATPDAHGGAGASDGVTVGHGGHRDEPRAGSEGERPECRESDGHGDDRDAAANGDGRSAGRERNAPAGELRRARLERDLRAVTFDREDQRRPRALVLWNMRAAKHADWAEDAERLLAEPRVRPGGRVLPMNAGAREASGV